LITSKQDGCGPTDDRSSRNGESAKPDTNPADLDPELAADLATAADLAAEIIADLAVEAAVSDCERKTGCIEQAVDESMPFWFNDHLSRPGTIQF
jgi:hypothetical protein